MTVTLTCDLCKSTLIIPPGEHQMQGYIQLHSENPVIGWRWITPASFQTSFRIHPETICDKCATAIDSAGKIARETEREKLRK